MPTTNSLKSSGCPPNPSVCLVLLHSGPKVVSYVQVLTKGYSQKVVYVRHFRVCLCTICRAYVQWSLHVSPHYKQQCTSTKPSVRLSKSPNYPSSVLSDPKTKLTRYLCLVNYLGHSNFYLRWSISSQNVRLNYFPQEIRIVAPVRAIKIGV